ncbi:ribokinase [Candidatus Bipolaricaulota bacterium]|nr:ribokinase [Candidatus Bipolaricaulota bacterium]
MSDVYVLGGMNMDYVLSLPKLPDKGETVKGSELLINPGGKGGNQAVAGAKLGGSVYMMSNVGDDAIGQQLLNSMEGYGVKTDYVGVLETEHSGTALIFVDPEGENMIGFSPGAAAKIDEGSIEKALSSAGEGDVFLSGLEPPVSKVNYAARTAAKNGMEVILNPAPAQDIPKDELFQFADVLTPNQTEASALLDTKIESVDDALSEGKTFLDWGIGTAVITLGSDGSVVINDRVHKHFPAQKLSDEVVDTTGAGDAFNAAIAVYLARQSNISKAVTFANKVAGLTVIKQGAQKALPTYEEVQEKRE